MPGRREQNRPDNPSVIEQLGQEWPAWPGGCVCWEVCAVSLNKQDSAGGDQTG